MVLNFNPVKYVRSLEKKRVSGDSNIETVFRDVDANK